MGQEKEEVKVRITAIVADGLLVIDTDNPGEQADWWVPAGNGKIGCVLMGTKTRLGISDEALALLRKVPRSRDAIGDIMWWSSVKGCCFGWLAGPRRILAAERLEGDRDYAVRDGEFVKIPNDVPEQVLRGLAMMKAKDQSSDPIGEWLNKGM